MAISIGADPEILLVDPTGKYISVEGKVGGTKSKPVRIDGLGPRYGAQEDNVMLEFNIPPAIDLRSFTRSIDRALAALQDSVVAPAGLAFSEEPTAVYGRDQLATSQASTFGCSPDMDAYLRDKAAGVSPTALGDSRCAGGHIHLGYSNKGEVPPFVVAQLADSFMGLYEVGYSGSQGIRRGFYGTAGRYREKPYGIEYRTLSNRWLFDRDLMITIGRGAYALAKMLDDGAMDGIHYLYGEIPHAEVQTAINSEDEVMARQLMEFVNVLREEVA